jgi:hypothetical protein
VFGHGAGHERADDRRDHPARRERRHDRGPQPLGVGAAHHHVQRDDHQTAAEALHGPAGDEQPHRPRRTGQQQARSERGDARRERPERSAPVGPLAGEHHAEERGGEVPREREAVQRDTVQLPCRNRHRGAHRGRLEGDQDDDRDDADAERAKTPPEHPSVFVRGVEARGRCAARIDGCHAKNRTARH